MKLFIIGGIMVMVLAGTYGALSMQDSFESQADTTKQHIEPTIETHTTEEKEDAPPTQQTVSSPTPAKDTDAPKAYILEPTDNAVVTLGTDVKIVANVTDDVQVDRVEFYAGSSDYQYIGTVKQAPFEVMWNVDSRFDGSINIPVYIKAFDTAGNQSSSAILVVAKKP